MIKIMKRIEAQTSISIESFKEDLMVAMLDENFLIPIRIIPAFLIQPLFKEKAMQAIFLIFKQVLIKSEKFENLTDDISINAAISSKFLQVYTKLLRIGLKNLNVAQSYSMYQLILDDRDDIPLEEGQSKEEKAEAAMNSFKSESEAAPEEESHVQKIAEKKKRYKGKNQMTKSSSVATLGSDIVLSAYLRQRKNENFLKAVNELALRSAHRPPLQKKGSTREAKTLAIEYEPESLPSHSFSSVKTCLDAPIVNRRRGFMFENFIPKELLDQFPPASPWKAIPYHEALPLQQIMSESITSVPTIELEPSSEPVPITPFQMRLYPQSKCARNLYEFAKPAEFKAMDEKNELRFLQSLNAQPEVDIKGIGSVLRKYCSKINIQSLNTNAFRVLAINRIEVRYAFLNGPIDPRAMLRSQFVVLDWMKAQKDGVMRKARFSKLISISNIKRFPLKTIHKHMASAYGLKFDCQSYAKACKIAKKLESEKPEVALHTRIAAAWMILLEEAKKQVIKVRLHEEYVTPIQNDLVWANLLFHKQTRNSRPYFVEASLEKDEFAEKLACPTPHHTVSQIEAKQGDKQVSFADDGLVDHFGIKVQLHSKTMNAPKGAKLFNFERHPGRVLSILEARSASNRSVTVEPEDPLN